MSRLSTLSRRDRWRYRLYRVLLTPIAWLPMWVLHPLADILAWLLRRVLHYRRAVVRRNLRVAFPEMSVAQLKEVERDFYHNLADCIIETVKLLHISDRTIYSRVTVTNGEVVDALAAQGRPIVLFLAHYGCWEWMPAMTASYSPTVVSGHIYKELHDAAADHLMQRMRSRFPSRGIELRSSVREILRMAQQNRRMMVGFISDHRFNSAPRRHTTRFLNQDTDYYIGGESIGRKIGAAYLYLDVVRKGRSRYELTFVPISADDDGQGPNPVTRRYYALLEQTIRRRPGLWLWSHKRWPIPRGELTGTFGRPGHHSDNSQ